MSFSDEITKAFDPETFRARAHALVDELAEHLSRTTRGEGKVWNWASPDERARDWNAELSESGGADPLELSRQVLQQAMQVLHPQFLGHQQGAPLPLNALCDLVVSVLNNSGAIYEMGPPFVMMEQSLLRWMLGLFAFGPRSSGVFTNGGTMGNLTAMLAARQRMSGGTAWDDGMSDERPPAVLVSSQAHYSIDRAIKIMGCGKDGVELVPFDDRFRLRVDALGPALERAENRGRKVIAVVASVCSTATGAFDPIEPIADFCEKHRLWLHADGAHGASVILSAKYRHLLKGIERVDSLVWDAHKLLLTPALTTAVLFKDESASCQTFAQQASYLFQKGAAEEWFNPCHRTLECTKRDTTFRLYATLRVHGTRLFADYVTRQHDLARELAALIRAQPDFELATEPESNIVCYRYLSKGKKDADAFQTRLRGEILRRGHFYVVQTKLPKGVYLRSALMNPFTERKHLEALLAEVRECAQLLSSH